MKKLFFILIPSLIVGLIVFLGFKLVTGSKTERGALQVTSVPTSKIYLDGTYIGQSPLCKCEAPDMLKTGEFTIRLVPENKDFSEFQEKITITKSVLTVVDRHFDKVGASEGSVISLAPLKDKKAVEITAMSFPGDAEVFLDGNTVGQAPITLRDVTESDHSIKMKKKGYKDKTVRVKTAAGYKLIANVYLGVSDEFVTPSAMSPTPIASLSAAPSIAKVLILETPTGFLRVRATNSTAGAEVGRVNPGESYELVGESEGWFQIRLANETTGWVSAQYTQKE